MSLKDIRSECTGVASLLQPYVDGELDDEERESVAAHLDDCEPCRAAVTEQLWVRATLRAMEPERAPQALRARILQGIDEIDREASTQAEAPTPGLWSRVAARTRDLMRGGLVMVPAGAVAAALFLVARGGFEQEVASLPGGGIGAALTGNEIATAAPTKSAPLATAPDKTPTAKPDVARALADIEPAVGFPIQVAPPAATRRIQLVGARLDDSAGSAAPPGARLRYRVFQEGRATGHHFIDQQRPVGGVGPAGTPVTFKGRRYTLQTGGQGEPLVHFERGGVAHMIQLEGEREAQDGEPDFSHLLDLAHQLAQNGQ